LGLVDDQDVEALLVAVAGDEGGVLGEDLVEGLLLVLLDGGVDDGLPLGALSAVLSWGCLGEEPSRRGMPGATRLNTSARYLRSQRLNVESIDFSSREMS